MATYRADNAPADAPMEHIAAERQERGWEPSRDGQQRRDPDRAGPAARDHPANVQRSAALAQALAEAAVPDHSGAPRRDRAAHVTKNSPNPVRRSSSRSARSSGRSIERQALLESCAELGGGGVVLLEAPAGFGKTSVLRQWSAIARKRRYGIAWLDLRPADKSVARLAGRLREAFGALGISQLPSMPVHAGAGDEDSSRFVAALVAGLAACRRRILLVLDDYHHIERGPADALLGELLERMPDNLLLALATRRSCPLALSRLMLEGRLRRLDGRSLLFSKAEARAFFGRAIGPAKLNELHELTEGWPAALRMAQLCLPRWRSSSIGIVGVAEYARLIGDYCNDEVLRYISPAAADLLSQCAIVETLDPGVCDAIRGASDSARILAGLAERETFMDPVDVQTCRWQLPRLLRWVLHQRALQRGGEWVAGAHTRAAVHLANAERTKDALHHYMSAGAPAIAAETLERATPLFLVLTRGDGHVQELLDLIPHSQFEHFPRLALCKVWLDYKRGLLAEARTQLAEIGLRTQNFTRDRPGGDDERLSIESLCVKLVMDFYRRSRATREYLRTIDQQLMQVRRGDARLAFLFELVLGLLHQLRGEFDAAEAHFIQCEKLNLKDRSSWPAVWMKYHGGTIALARGNLTQARYHLLAGLRAWRSEFNAYPSYGALVQLALAEIAYETDALSEAQAHLDEGLYAAEHIEGWFEPYACIYEIGMMLHWHAGRIDQVEALLARGVAIERVGVLLQDFLAVLRVRFELLRGRLDAAQELIDAQHLASRWQGEAFQDECTHREWDLLGACLSLLAIRRGDWESASRIVCRLDEVARRAGRERTIAKASILNSIVAHGRGDAMQAAAHLLAALEIGHAQGYRRVFLDEGTLVGPILQALNECEDLPIPGHLRLYATSLRGLLNRSCKDASQRRGPALSEREQDVLRELSLGHSNKLIARKLGLSASTVKFHVSNVFRKLDVRKRTAAVAEAHRRGWLN